MKMISLLDILKQSEANDKKKFYPKTILNNLKTL